MILAKSSDDVIEALSRDNDELAEIAERAYQRTLTEHTGEHRADELIHYLEEAMSGSAREKTRSVSAKGEVA